MKKLILPFIVLGALSSAEARGVWDFGGTLYNVDTVYHVTVGPGMTTTALRIEGAQQGVNNSIKNNVFYTTVDLNNPNLELRSVAGQDQVGKVESVKAMCDRKNKEGNGQYIAGINGDFFNGSTDNKPLGHVIVGGKVLQASTDAWWKNVAAHIAVEGAKNIQITEDLNISGSTVLLNGLPTKLSHAISGCPMIVINGEPVSDAYIQSHLGASHFTSNQARTAIGYNKDRTKLIMLVVDKFTTNKYTTGEYSGFKASTGFAIKRMGQLMANLGCETAMAMDGGGSSQLYNYKLGTRNIPYGENGYLRPVSNGFFVVSTTPVDETVTSIEVFEKNVILTTGQTFTPTVFGYNKYGVLVNRNVTNFTVTAAQQLGTVSGKTLTAGSGSYATEMVVKCGSAVCGVNVSVNGGATFVKSGDVPAPKLPYTPDEPLGDLNSELELSEHWSFLNNSFNDGWDGTAPNWSNASAIKSKSCPRFATAVNGKLYTVDMKTMSIAEIRKDGELTPKYKLPELTGAIGGVKDYYGCAISSDEAGNFVIGHYFTLPASFYVWTVYNPETGKCKHFEFPMNGKTPSRIDCVGRVIGDLTKDAYLFVAPSYDGGVFQCGNMLHFTGDGNIDNLTATNEFTPLTYLSNRTASYCQSIFTDPADITALQYTQDAVVCYSKSEGFSQWSNSMYGYANGALSNNRVTNWENYAGTSAFDMFTLGGKLYYVINYVDKAGSADNLYPMDVVVTDAQFNTVAQWKSKEYKSNGGYSSIIARPVSNNAVEIFVYNCTNARTGTDKSGAISGACLHLYAKGHEDDFDSSTSGIEEIDNTVIDETVEDAQVVYYNLQGVRVVNPSNGIYIVRRGNKVSKEYIR